MASIELQAIGKVFPGSGAAAIRDVSLTIANGERLVLVGPSGSGKSTLLRIIAGLEMPSAGRVLIGGSDVTDVPPEQRDLAMVFQSYALYPHKTVRGNLAFGLRMRRVAAPEIERRVRQAAAALGLEPLLDRMPSQLSGGQRQRVAVGRALVRDPQAFLFDEPLSNLDPQLRGETRAELIDLHSRLRATMVYVTHDQEEAMTLGQRIAILNDGRIEQVGPPQALYERPASLFVARFLGTPPMNVVDAASFPALARGLPQHAASIGFRPHEVRLTSVAERHEVTGTIELVEPLGHAQIVHVRVDPSTRVVVVAAAEARPQPGAAVGLSIPADRRHVFDSHGKTLATEEH
ncbi:MAG TPA: ABC transporter ATP-binding protein [Vicinamibacterales bacterium]|nr:ABC transporter ATP-binding protein [Vicinamibacterales bacterium]